MAPCWKPPYGKRWTRPERALTLRADERRPLITYKVERKERHMTIPVACKCGSYEVTDKGGCKQCTSHFAYCECGNSMTKAWATGNHGRCYSCVMAAKNWWWEDYGEPIFAVIFMFGSLWLVYELVTEAAWIRAVVEAVVPFYGAYMWYKIACLYIILAGCAIVWLWSLCKAAALRAFRKPPQRQKPV